MKTYEGQRVETVDSDGTHLKGTVMGRHEGQLVVRWDSELYDDAVLGSLVGEASEHKLMSSGVSALALAFMNAKRRK